MKGWLLVSLFVLGSCSPVQPADPEQSAPAVFSEAEFVAQIRDGAAVPTSWHDGQLDWRNPSIHIGELDTVVVELSRASGSECTEARIDDLSVVFRTLPTDAWPDGRSILMRTTFGGDPACSARVCQQAERARAVAERLQIQIAEIMIVGGC